MRCPLCDVPMREVTRRGVKVDICPECRGVWLDPGELKHLIDAAPDDDPAFAPAGREPGRSERVEPRYEDARYAARRRDDDNDDDDDRRRALPQRKKRGSWLSEIFEMGGGD